MAIPWNHHILAGRITIFLSSVFLCFSYGFPMVFLGFPMVFLWFSWVFPWFSYGFPVVFLGFPMVFLWFSHGLRTKRGTTSSPWIGPRGGLRCDCGLRETWPRNFWSCWFQKGEWYHLVLFQATHPTGSPWNPMRSDQLHPRHIWFFNSSPWKITMLLIGKPM